MEIFDTVDIPELFDLNLLETDTDVETEVLISSEERLDELQTIMLYNDDYNTFDFVIESLVKVCKHDLIQAEQCTYLVHYKGKCAVKTGTYNRLKPICIALLDRGLTAEII